jgi:Cof subfamily protein (haloacid dehalogenase superfamily)
MSIRLIAVDLDETLLRADKSVCPESASKLREALSTGIHVVIATSRRLDTVKGIAKTLGIINQPVICADGALIMSNPYGEIWQSLTIPRAIALPIAQHADTHHWELTVVAGDTTYYRQRAGQALGHLMDDLYIVDSIQAMVNIEPMRIFTRDAVTIKGIVEFIEEKNYTDKLNLQYYYNPDDSIESLGIFPQFSNKGKALIHVAERLNIPLEETLALGDGSNDIPMFEVAGISVAMANARDVVKRHADFLTASNNDGGVARAIEKYVLS